MALDILSQLGALLGGGGAPPGAGGGMPPQAAALMQMFGGGGAPPPMGPQTASLGDPNMLGGGAEAENAPLSFSVPSGHDNMAALSGGESYMDSLKYSNQSPGEGLRPMRAQGPGEPPGPLPQGAGGPPSTEEEIEEVQKGAGLSEEEYQWEGDEEAGPSPADLKYIQDNPTDAVLEDFENHFGYPPDVSGKEPPKDAEETPEEE